MTAAGIPDSVLDALVGVEGIQCSDLDSVRRMLEVAQPALLIVELEAQVERATEEIRSASAELGRARVEGPLYRLAQDNVTSWSFHRDRLQRRLVELRAQLRGLARASDDAGWRLHERGSEREAVRAWRVGSSLRSCSGEDAGGAG